MRRLLLLLVLFAAAATPAGVVAAEEDDDPAAAGPMATPVRALLFEEDEVLRRTYDGIRKGLEQAWLPRVSLEEAREGAAADAILERLAADPPQLLFVLGRAARARLGGRLADVPRVFVDTAWSVNGEAVPPASAPEGRAAVVRAVVSAVHVAQILRDLGLERPPALLSWIPTDAADEAGARALATAAGFRLAAPDETPRALLHLRLGRGGTLPDGRALARRAEDAGIPLLSDDLAHWLEGRAAVVVTPDAELLGRVAAEQARKLVRDPDALLAPRLFSAYEVRVDLGAAARQGLEPPLGFLARADELRRARRGSAP